MFAAKGGETMNTSDIFLSSLSGFQAPSAKPFGGSSGAGEMDFSAMLKGYLENQASLAGNTQEAGRGNTIPERSITGLSGKKNLSMLKSRDPLQMDRSNERVLTKEPNPKRAGLYGISQQDLRKIDESEARPEAKKNEAKPSSEIDHSREVDAQTAMDPAKKFEEIRSLAREFERVREESQAENPEEMLAALKQDPATAALFQNLDPAVAEALVTQLMSAFPQMSVNPIMETLPATDEEMARQLLEVMRQDPKDGAFWQSMDDQTGMQLLQTMMATGATVSTASSLTEEDSEIEGDLLETITSDVETAPTQLRAARSEALNDGTLADEYATLQQAANAAQDESETSDEAATEQTEQTQQQAPQTDGMGNVTAFGAPADVGMASAARLVPIPTVMSELTPLNANGKTIDLDRILSSLAQEITSKTRELDPKSQQHQNSGQGFAQPMPQIREDARAAKGQQQVRATVFHSMVQQASLTKNAQDHRSLTIQLRPEYLGKVQVELTSKDGAVTARILTENEQVRGKIEEISSQVKSHLEQLGIRLEQFTVDVSTKNPDDRNNNFERHAPFTGFKIRGSRKQVEDILEDESSGPVVLTTLSSGGVDITI
jgi:flagellar hook-length control protein FliK